MDINVLLAVAGIIVSIGVGFGTFYLADKRARRNRWESAKETVLRDLSKSLGEGNVPDASVIKATIRSVLRSHNANDLSENIGTLSLSKNSKNSVLCHAELVSASNEINAL